MIFDTMIASLHICISRVIEAQKILSGIYGGNGIFDEDRPFPNGVERVWNKAQKHSKVVWKQTGEEYHGPQPDKAKFTVGDASPL
ncbi:hypothetical protein M408DRAFT_332327 [Serendipita vermifera MAFF 305830]|uniref:Uncharacterized protein n=1 Tax=Serendipita vermifera MAFF 305830 TaxID=933852 RepID=A0A0C3AW32_SERVB|nr:hypothetical protein M408DRAFT_332327 [Serendipita vermifera MAFF 305830]